MAVNRRFHPNAHLGAGFQFAPNLSFLLGNRPFLGRSVHPRILHDSEYDDDLVKGHLKTTLGNHGHHNVHAIELSKDTRL